MLINCTGQLYIYNDSIEQVHTARYLGVEIRSNCTRRAARCKSMAITRYTKAQQGMHMVKSHVRYSGIKSRLIRTMLVEAFATSRLMFGAVIWGHVLGPRMLLHRTGCTVATRIEVSHRRHLRWALGLPRDIRTGLLYVLANQLPFQGLVAKQ